MAWPHIRIGMSIHGDSTVGLPQQKTPQGGCMLLPRECLLMKNDTLGWVIFRKDFAQFSPAKDFTTSASLGAESMQRPTHMQETSVTALRW